MSKQAILRSVVEPCLRNDLPDIRPGDTLRVHTKVIEGDKERIQIFEGVVLGLNNGGIAANVIVRKSSYGIGVERIFPLHSPYVDKFEVIRRSKVRRAKLYYLRTLSGKKARLKELR